MTTKAGQPQEHRPIQPIPVPVCIECGRAGHTANVCVERRKREAARHLVAV